LAVIGPNVEIGAGTVIGSAARCDAAGRGEKQSRRKFETGLYEFVASPMILHVDGCWRDGLIVKADLACRRETVAVGPAGDEPVGMGGVGGQCDCVGRVTDFL